jgi:hypothetical protein
MATFDHLTEELRDGSNLTEACFDLLQALRNTVETELALRGLEVVVSSPEYRKRAFA